MYAATRAGAVVIVADEQDSLPYETAAAHAAECRRNTLVIETAREALGTWTEFVYALGVAPEQVCAFISEPSLPEGLDLDVVELPPAKPRGPVH